MKILYKDKLGNEIVEKSSGGIGLKNKEGKFCTHKDFKSFVKEHKLGNKIRFRERGNIWVHNDFLK